MFGLLCVNRTTAAQIKKKKNTQTDTDIRTHIRLQQREQDAQLAGSSGGFTNIFITLEPAIISELNSDDSMARLCTSLSHIYHFWLYGLNFLRVNPCTKQAVPTAPILPWHVKDEAAVAAGHSSYGVSSEYLPDFALNRIALEAHDVTLPPSSASFMSTSAPSLRKVYDLHTELSNLRTRYQLGGHHLVLFFTLRITVSREGQPTIATPRGACVLLLLGQEARSAGRAVERAQ